MKPALLIFTPKDFLPALCVAIADNTKTMQDHHTSLLADPLSIVAGTAKETPALPQVRLCIGVSNRFAPGFGQHTL
jgi:hypothetical protein